jgi:hypothetical protein
VSSASITTSPVTWPGLEEFDEFGPSDLRNGLTDTENSRLAETVHVDEAAALILRGLLNTRKNKSRGK